VNFPEPREGLVIRYSYLWNREHQAGREEGIKERPCAIVLTVVDTGGKRRVLAAPVTHTPPTSPRDAVEIPAAIKRRLGLDSERSWIVIGEANRFTWPGPDLRTIPGRDLSTIVYGMLPPNFFEVVRSAFFARFTEMGVKTVPRSE
jgi:hypothetical protein